MAVLTQPWQNCVHADGMVITHLPYGPSAYFGIHNTVLRHDIGQKKEVRLSVPCCLLGAVDATAGFRVGSVVCSKGWNWVRRVCSQRVQI